RRISVPGLCPPGKPAVDVGFRRIARRWRHLGVRRSENAQSSWSTRSTFPWFVAVAVVDLLDCVSTDRRLLSTHWLAPARPDPYARGPSPAGAGTLECGHSSQQTSQPPSQCESPAEADRAPQALGLAAAFSDPGASAAEAGSA